MRTEAVNWRKDKGSRAPQGVVIPDAKVTSSDRSCGSAEIGRIDLCRIRLYVYDRCHAPAAQSRAPQSRARPVARVDQLSDAVEWLAQDCSISPRQAIAISNGWRLAASPAKRPAGVRQTSAQPGPPRPHVRCGQGIVHQRGGQPGVARAAATRARAWVSRNQFGHIPYSWNIISTVCCQTSSRTCISCSCRIYVSQSELILRNKRILRQE